MTGGLAIQVRRAGRSDARVMALMRYAFRTELGAPAESERDQGVDTVVLWPSPRSVPLYARHGFRRQGDVMELRWAATSSPDLSPAAEPVSLPGPDSVHNLHR